jgi:hypothetical protein
VSLVPALALTLIAASGDPKFNGTKILIGYVASFFFWYGLHRLWAYKLKPTEVS